MRLFNKAKTAATMTRKNRVVVASSDHILAAASTLEGQAELLLDIDEEMIVPVQMKVVELRAFVAYMRAIDETARNNAKAAEEYYDLKAEYEVLNGKKLAGDAEIMRLRKRLETYESKESQEAAKARKANARKPRARGAGRSPLAALRGQRSGGSSG